MAEENENPEESTADFLNKLFGNPVDPMLAGWVSVHETYKGLRAGGFARGEALVVVANMVVALGREDDSTE